MHCFLKQFFYRKESIYIQCFELKYVNQNTYFGCFREVLKDNLKSYLNHSQCSVLDFIFT